MEDLKELDLYEGRRISFGEAVNLAALLDSPSFRLLLVLIQERQVALLTDLKIADEDDEILRSAKAYKLALQEEVDILYWPQLCARLTKEESYDTGGTDQNVSGEPDELGPEGGFFDLRREGYDPATG